MKEIPQRTPPMHIAMLSIHSSPIGPLGTQNTGGMSVYVRELARWLGHQGHQVDIFTCADCPGGHQPLYPNVRLIGLLQDEPRPLEKTQLPAHFESIFTAMDKYRCRQRIAYDLIHSHYWISAVVGAMAQTRWHCPHLIMFHTLGTAKNLATAAENEPIRRLAHERWLAKVADGIVAPSAGERQNLLCHYHPQPEIIHTIPCGVDPDLFKPMDQKAARKSIGLDTDGRVALYVGRFAPVKGVHNLIETAALVKKRNADLRWVLVGGDGPKANSTHTLKHLIHRQQVQSQVTLAGRIDHKSLPLYYNAADFLVMPSFYESFGLVMLEALACGTPVVTTPVGMASAIIQEGINGVVADSPDPEALAMAVYRMLDGPQDSQATVRKTIHAYSWKKVAAAVRKTYGSLLDVYHPVHKSRSTSGWKTYSK